MCNVPRFDLTRRRIASDASERVLWRSGTVFMLHSRIIGSSQSAAPASHLAGAEASYPTAETAEVCGSSERIRRCWLRSSVNLPSRRQNAAARADGRTMPIPAAVEVVDRYRIPIRRNPERNDHERVIGTVGCVQIWVVVAALREVVLQRSS